MEILTLKELAVPMIKAIDSFNFLLKSHHRKTAVIAYYIGKELNLNEKDMFELVVASALHDIGALSIQDQAMLKKVDVTNPGPHCLMGYRMLESFDAFNNIAQIIKHHHIKYDRSLKAEPGEVLFASHIVHIADRIDIIISPTENILYQKNRVTEKIKKMVDAKLFHPKVFDAYKKVANKDIFWIEINHLDIVRLFDRFDFKLDIELSIDSIISFSQIMSRIIDFRSKFTAAHSFTVANLAHLLGGYFGFSEERCNKLMIAGYFHDIGKLGIDPRLIEKKGKLTDEEFGVVKMHTYYTAQILNELNTSDWFSEIVRWAVSHHERSDGSGYPYSYKGEELDVGDKILAFSDIITALMEERPYRESLSIDAAFGIIKDKESLKISTEMFGVIEKNKDEINDLVLRCQKNKLVEYSLS